MAKATKKTPVKKTPRRATKKTPAKKTPKKAPSKKANMNAGGLAAMWNKSREKSNNFNTVPDIVDGTYCAQITEVKTGIAKKTRERWYSFKLEITQGEYEGTELTIFHTLNDKIAFNDVSRIDLFTFDLQRMGIDTKQLTAEDVEGPLAEFLTDSDANEYADASYAVRVKNNTDSNGVHRVNIYLQKMLDEAEVSNWEDTHPDEDE